MPRVHSAHFLIQSEDIEKTKNWYVDILGLEEGFTPDFKFPVYWLYLGGQDVLHLTQGGAGVTQNRMQYVGQESQATRGTGVIDHIAFGASGLDEMIAHFKKTGTEFKERQVDAK